MSTTYRLTFMLLAAICFAVSAATEVWNTISAPEDNYSHKYLVQVPTGYDDSKPVPLVIDLHGHTKDALKEKGSNDMDKKADAAGWIIVWPEGWLQKGGDERRGWNAGGCCSIAQKEHRQHVELIRNLVAKLKQDYAIDEKRVYVMGRSNGGMMANRLAAQATDLFAAAAGISGQLCHDTTMGEDNWYSVRNDFDGFAPAEPISILHTSSRDDATVPYTGGIGTNSIAGCIGVEEAIETWAEHNSCETSPTVTNYNNQTVLRQWTSCDGNVNVYQYATETGGHSSFPPSYFPLADIIFEFFNAHVKGESSVGNSWVIQAAQASQTPRVARNGVLPSSARRITIPQGYTHATVVTPQGRVLWRTSGAALELPENVRDYTGVRLIQYR